MTALTIAILAGGKSTRMGQNKALMTIGDQSIIEHVIATSTCLSPSEILIVTNTPQDYAQFGYRLVADTITEQGAIGGIISALHHSLTDRVLILACDSPFVHPTLLKMMIQEFNNGQFQAVIPTVADYPQGVIAIYHRDCQPYFESAIQNDQRKLKSIFNQLNRVLYVDESYWQTIDPQGQSFININTPDDLERARTVWQQQSTQYYKPE